MPIKPVTIVLWLFLYLMIALLPMLIAMGIERPAPRNLLVETGSMLGLLGLGMLATQLIISGRHRWFAGGLGQDNLLQFHRRTGIAAWIFILSHPILLMLGDRQFVAWLDPTESWLRAGGVIALALAVTALIVSSLWRKELGLQYETWRTLHASLSLFVVAGGLGHALMGQHHTAGLLTQGLLILVVAIPLLLLLETRLWRPYQLQKRPWRVVESEETRADSTDLILVAEGHRGMNFKPGQFAWLTMGDSPFSTQQHPFSMASSASNPGHLEFVIKEAGDFTHYLSTVKPGDKAYLEGPYGVFTMDPKAKRRAVFIVGGIGITPILSMIRSRLDELNDTPMWLIYANKSEAEIIMRNTLEAFAEKLPLRVIHVLSDPSDEWMGESGYVDGDVLDDYLPEDAEDIDYFVCGPPPMMDLVEPELQKRGVKKQRVYSERFNLV
ncbi:ferredoxin reductase family protein [Methylophaga pinxianii]|uniref:ferredoxin reductase family protein n=1 Tax=Methylophaga pinxianii TaxID=2881052 RepID=UPI001CF1BC9E|nr:ferredoxin reductase family protein [Methylophaga pinxianii]MCB2427703.1 ferredoxin reductase family protein [Methylophaga pinxianii]UPH46206.1 ferredoxin reductase family protein [Methylophaga pinxianii]